MKQTILTLLLSACCLTLSAASDTLLPAWFGQEDASTRIGIAPPATDEAQARSIALINATLSYLRTQQEGKMAGHTSYKLSTEGEGADDYDSYLQITSKSAVRYSDFDCKILDEYRNSRGEYFVRCRFSKNASAHSHLSIEQEMRSTGYGEHSDQLLTAKIELTLKDHRFQSLFRCDVKDGQDAAVTIATKEGEVALPQGLSYGRWTASKTSGYSSLPFAPAEMGLSLGALQLSTYCMLPFIPKRMAASGQIMSQSTNEENGGDKGFSYRSIFSALSDSVCTPYDIRFGSLSKKGLQLQIQHANFNDTESSYETPGTVQAGAFADNDRSTGIQRLMQAQTLYISGLFEAWTYKSREQQSEGTFSSEQSTLRTTVSRNSATNIGVRWDFSNVPSEKALRAEVKKAVKNGQAFPRHGFWVSIR